MSYITAFITALCAACVFTGALYMLSPGGVMEKPVRYILGLVFLVIVISSAGVTLGTAEWDAVFPAADEIPRQSLDAASAEYVYGAVLEASGINFSEITVCTDKSDDGSIIRAANGDAIPAQAIDRAAKVRSANLKSGLQFTAGDDSQLTAVILLQVFGNRVVRRHEDSFPGQLPGKSAKKAGAVSPFRVTAPVVL